MTLRAGGCLCGAVRYESEGEPQFSLQCHCRDCQRQSGAPHVAAVRVPAAAFRIVRGTPRHYVAKADSGNDITRVFCGDCGTPLYVQLLLCYTGLYSLQVVRDHVLLNEFFRNGMNCTLLAFTLNTCAYTTEIFAGAIRATPYGEIEAARAYGMSSFTLYRRVILPSALRRALPYYSNEVILMLHATTVAFTATVPDILKIARDVNSATYQSFQAFGIAGLLYLCISFALVWMFRRAEHRWLAYLRPQGK